MPSLQPVLDSDVSEPSLQISGKQVRNTVSVEHWVTFFI